jgi:hypothetical protein
LKQTELLEQMRAARADFEAALARIPLERQGEPGAAGEWSAKDVLAHVMAYDRWTAAQLTALKRGTPATPRELYDMDEAPRVSEPFNVDVMNEMIYDYHRDIPLDEVRAAADQAFARFLAAVEALSDNELAAPHDFTGGRPLWTVVPGQSFEHYREHAAALRARSASAVS